MIVSTPEAASRAQPSDALDEPSTWADFLDALEADVIAAEHLAAGRGPIDIPETSATAPTTPLPVEIADRARDLLARQQRAIEALPDAIVRIKRQLDVTRKVGQATTPTTRTSVYIDTSA